MSPCQLKEKLQKLFNTKMDLVIKNNRCVLVKVKKKWFSWQLILHSVFLQATDKELRALKAWVLNAFDGKNKFGKQDCKQNLQKEFVNPKKYLEQFLQDKIQIFYKENLNCKQTVKQTEQNLNNYNCYSSHDFCTRPRPADFINNCPVKLQPAGKVFNLQQIFVFLNKTYFQNQLDLLITWKKVPVYKKYRQITFGSFNQYLKLIRINSLLDSSEIPYYFVCFVVYHEMLHYVYPMKIVKNRRQVHFKAFKEAEKKFLQYKQAKIFKRKFVKEKFYGRT